MSTAQEIAEQAISKMDAEEAEKPTAPEVPKKEEKDTDDTQDTTADSGADADKPKEGEADKGDADKKDEKEFTAEEALEVEEPKSPEAPKDNAGVMLSPDEQKYIVDNIGDPLVIRGMRGDKEVELKVYTPDQIPTDFKFTSDAAMLAAQTGLTRLEQRAEQMLGNYRSNQSREAANDFEIRENQGIVADVADLQKSGDFPKFKQQPGTAGFDDTPEAKQMADVLKVMTERNEQYMKEYQQGRPYKHIGFKEAFELQQAKSPKKEADKAQADEDKERKEVADKIGTNRGLSASSLKKATVPSGTTVTDIINRIDSEEW